MVSVKDFRKPTVILITGVPGVGKSTIAVELAKKLRINEIIATDIIRETMRSHFDKQEAPVLFEVTHCAWKIIGSKTPENIIKGYREQINLLSPIILKTIKSFLSEGKDLIVDGPHTPFIDTKSLSGIANIIKVVLIVENPGLYSKRLQEKFESRHRRRKKKWQDHFDEISIMQDFIIKNSLRDLLIDNIDKKQTVEKIINYIKTNAI